MESSNAGIPFSDEMKRDYTSIGGAPHLDGKYTVFGEVVTNIEVLKILLKWTQIPMTGH